MTGWGEVTMQDRMGENRMSDERRKEIHAKKPKSAKVEKKHISTVSRLRN